MEYPPSDEEIRRRVEKRLHERQGVLIHVVLYILLNVFMLLLYFATSPGDYFWPMWIIGPWGIGLIVHLLYYYYEYGAGRHRREQYIQQEMERERERLYGYTKRKNDDREAHSFGDDDPLSAPHVRLTKDGELTDSFVDDLGQEERRKNRE